jgi:translation initiation factor 2B subunit (eIF-2B alpha/beta/delta family)
MDAIARDRERGASLLALDAMDALASGARAAGSLAEAVELARALRSARPSMPVIANLVNLAMTDALGGSASEVLTRVPRTALAARERALEARGAAAKQAASLARGVVLTHSACETVAKTLRAAARAGVLSRVVVAEGRPGMEGRQVARSLAAEGVDVVLVVDAALGLHAREADAALVGADAVLPDGALVNKVGTRLLALACERAGTPLFAACDRFKVSPAATLPLEEKSPEEVWPDAPRGVGVRNIYFDRTEASLVRAFATDAGELAPREVGRLAEEHAGWAAWEAKARALTR